MTVYEDLIAKAELLFDKGQILLKNKNLFGEHFIHKAKLLIAKAKDLTLEEAEKLKA
jgi:hypothetical protein